MNGGRTWRFDSGGLVGWNYRPMARSDGRLVRLDLEDPEIRTRWLCDLVSRLPALLAEFAYPTLVSVSTREREYACEIDWPDKEGPPALLAFLRQSETTTVHARLNLTCLDRDVEPMEIAWGADFLVNIRLTDSGVLDPMMDAPVYLRFDLNADIYAPRSFGDLPDNALLAGINGPRLTAFLERIERDVPTQFLDMDGERYGGLVGPRGFTTPANAFRDA